MQYAVFDFETTGIGKDADRRPYNDERIPSPRPNFPIELSVRVITQEGVEVASYHTLIRGATRFDPWVRTHCPHLTVERCERDGCSFKEALETFARLIVPGKTTIVAHNIKYDWDEVIEQTANEMGLHESDAYRKLVACPQFDTMVNEFTKNNAVNGKKTFFFTRIQKWIGPKLSDLALHLKVPYDETKAHDATYDTQVTAQCTTALLKRQ